MARKRFAIPETQESNLGSLCLIPRQQVGPGPKPTFILKKKGEREACIYRPIESKGGECILPIGSHGSITRDPEQLTAKVEAESPDPVGFSGA